MAFVMLAHARSGSESLLATLNLHEEIYAVSEPFNPNYKDWDVDNDDYRSKIIDVRSLYEQLEAVGRKFNGIKTTDEDLPRELNEVLVGDTRFKLIFLRRSNLLQAVVSQAIADRTGLWQKWDAAGRIADYYGSLGKLDVHQLSDRLAQLDDDVSHYGNLVASRRYESSVMLTYEDLYFAPRDARAGMVNRLLRFLDCSPLALDEVDRYMAPRNGQLNSQELYRLITNCDSIEARLGSDRTGWLFAPH
ncbi:hypothetical protein [Plantactinospora sp. KLBMP9567]|uniref:hypothetical protein n=1 Tax=Plantactinospora sp. KLBMP9567 TaxID=3085900 RepID=UPI0029824505|nr:hypothetical protein [Plantactinospora sp. KLBMP9567]MDW5328899.1 hypothetical protein [Plantactinospora sp. KLBMP9567]